MDNFGKICKTCHKGAYKETRFFDDMDGLLHCDKCDAEIIRHVKADPLEVAKEALEKITEAYESDIYCLSDAILVAQHALDDIDKIKKGVII